MRRGLSPLSFGARRVWAAHGTSIGLVAAMVVAPAVPARATPMWSVSASQKPFGPPKGSLGRAACPSTTSCFAVGGTGGGTTLIEHFNGSSWSVVTSANAAGSAELNGVACPSSTSCFAVGFVSGSTTKTLVEQWDGTSWSIVPSPNGIGATGSFLERVACPSTTSCFAVGFSSVSSGEKTLVERWNGTSWSLVGSPNPTDGSDRAGLADVACTAPTSCIAVGSKSSTAATKTFTERWNGTSWAIVASPNPSGANQSQLLGVSCAYASSCVAVGAADTPSGETTLVERWNGTSWAIVASPNPATAVSANVDGVECTTGADCFAVGEYNDGTVDQSLVERWNGTSWSIVSSPNPAGSVESQLFGVACLSGTNCFAVGGAGYQPGDYTVIDRWNGTAWSIVAAPAGSSESQLSQVACATTTSCFAGGNFVTSTVRKTLTERWDGTSWSMVATPAPGSALQSVLKGVSCPSTTNCVAVGQYVTNAHATKTLVERWNGASWSIVANPNPSGTSSASLEAVACPTATSCVAVGSYVTNDATQERATLVESWNGTSWSIVASPTPSGGADLHGVSCASATSCFAVGESSGTFVEGWNGVSWSIVASPNPTGATGSRLSGVACPSVSLCIAVGQYGTATTVQTLIERWNGTSWAVIASPNRTGTDESLLLNVTCPSTTMCVAVGHDYSSATNFNDEPLIEQWDGTSWSIVPSPKPAIAIAADLSGVSCPSTATCYAVGDHSTPSSDFLLTEQYA